MTTLQFRSEDARIVYLATIFHLGRPGSETDPNTLQRHDLGLRAIHDYLVPRLNQAVVEVEASPYQVVRLGEALLGCANELKQFSLAQGRSMVPRFAETVRELYPETAEEPGAAMDLVQHPVMLRNRMQQAVNDAQAQIQAAIDEQRAQERAKKRWWEVWKN
ncbi:MAG: hypothetical protein KC461_14395 [Dehalococcoidia bacterium]|nr:hypothetical protein [Dehalococcoidia bacterium]MCA9851819.1 hypothetical protein [Dehalococcoidia bacterium]MCA9857869.1 hypothetical protein [Dehalococcoidia bacterium]